MTYVKNKTSNTLHTILFILAIALVIVIMRMFVFVLDTHNQNEKDRVLQSAPKVELPIVEKIGCSITEKQREVLQYSYSYGQKYNLGISLAAIALQESHAGMVNINLQDPSAGYYHVTLDKVLKLKKWPDNGYNRNRAAQLLIEDTELAASLAVSELQYWMKIHGKNSMKVFGSYNNGFVGVKTPKGQNYANNIKDKIQKINYCGWVEPSQKLTLNHEINLLL